MQNTVAAVLQLAGLFCAITAGFALAVWVGLAVTAAVLLAVGLAVEQRGRR